ncbi:hypothetical protein CI104_10290 [Citrobacter farmeri]|uniref:Uncharacterized protein n=1 Tax=Citrobacter farmeri TaxID=67824 RepID=A0ACA8DDD6_9ENTR|nr:hypothetical protein CI104_10290 [Citrobacter farmeri]
MDNQALGQLNPCIVQHAGSWFRHLAGPFFTLRAYPGDRSLFFV